MTTGKSLKTQGFRDALQFLLSTAVNCQSAIVINMSYLTYIKSLTKRRFYLLHFSKNAIFS